MKPLVVPTKLMIEYNVPAKFGAKSCEFCNEVTVDAPLEPNDNVMMATHIAGLLPTYVIEMSKRPGRMCAMNGAKNN